MSKPTTTTPTSEELAAKLRLSSMADRTLYGETAGYLHDAAADLIASQAAQIAELTASATSWKSLYERFAHHLRRAHDAAVAAGGNHHHGEFDTAEAVQDIAKARDEWKARATTAEAALAASQERERVMREAMEPLHPWADQFHSGVAGDMARHEIMREVERLLKPVFAALQQQETADGR